MHEIGRCIRRLLPSSTGAKSIHQQSPSGFREERKSCKGLRDYRAVLTVASIRRIKMNNPAHATKITPEMSAAGTIASSCPARKASRVAVNNHICTISRIAIKAIAPSIAVSPLFRFIVGLQWQLSDYLRAGEESSRALSVAALAGQIRRLSRSTLRGKGIPADSLLSHSKRRRTGESISGYRRQSDRQPYGS